MSWSELTAPRKLAYAQALLAECPSCGALPGAGCISRDGTETQGYPHKARTLVAPVATAPVRPISHAQPWRPTL